VIHTIIGGETLDALAARYYGREDLWWRIADANPLRFPLDWRPGDTVVIPPVRIATRVPRR
jgi:nucleoid-associated protein YgaU